MLTACNGTAAELFTYSASTAVRATLLAAGFFVATGRPIADRPETTIALTAPVPHPSHPLLTTDWLTLWRRSEAKFPTWLPPDDRAAFESAIEHHPQFTDA